MWLLISDGDWFSIDVFSSYGSTQPPDQGSKININTINETFYTKNSRYYLFFVKGLSITTVYHTKGIEFFSFHHHIVFQADIDISRLLAAQ